jgi:hypothetical protein
MGANRVDDFPKPKTAAARPAHKALTEWVKDYFVSRIRLNPLGKADVHF